MLYMTTPSKLLSTVYKTSILAFYLLSFTHSVCAESTPSTSSFSEISSEYHRKMLPTGRYEPETYALGKGICYDKKENDNSLHALTFREIGAQLTEALAEADYVPTPGPEETDLVIVVSWGRSVPPTREFGGETTTRMADAFNLLYQNKVQEIMGSNENGNKNAPPNADALEAEIEMMLSIQRMEDQARWKENLYNAKLMGYKDELLWAYRLQTSSMTMRFHYDDLLGEIEHPRYFVILQAYDFQKMWKEKKKVLLWTTRFSIRAKGHKFDEELRNMALAASRTFGTDSDKLQRGLTPARIEYGEIEYIGVVDEEEEK